MSSTSVPLINDYEHFKLALQTYHKYNANGEALQDWIEIKLSQRIKDLFGGKTTIRILAYDPDEPALYFLKEVARCAKKKEEYTIEYQVVAPNCSRYREIVGQAEDLTNITFHWYTGDFRAFLNDFKAETSEISKFDVVHFFRGFYDIDSAETLQLTYENLLFVGGIVAVIGQDKKSFWYKMMHFLADNKMEHEYFKCSGNISDSYFLSGWLAQAREKDWAYHSYIRDYDFHITPLYLTGGKDSYYLLDYLFSVKDARINVPEVIISEFMNFLEREKRDSDGRKYFPNKFGAIMITKE